MGIKAYNAKCRSIVMRCEEEWKEVVPRMGRWIDFEGGYKTMDPTYMARRPPPPPAAASRPALLAGAAPRAALRAQRSADLGCVSQESVWWVFKTLWDKGLIYRGFKVMPYSMACATPISNFEVRTAARAPAVSLTSPSPAQLRSNPHPRLLSTERSQLPGCQRPGGGRHIPPAGRA